MPALSAESVREGDPAPTGAKNVVEIAKKFQPKTCENDTEFLNSSAKMRNPSVWSQRDPLSQRPPSGSYREAGPGLQGSDSEPFGAFERREREDSVI
ncbi:hypothetical protein G0U57_020179 [Chelydra serpentina]|uniref:Uncharacterized protein n=1 Tax=Chelydra serpentina TaxID=8475 RepID=A0A8T1S342_CHESE|nr:hypothetical protein G0U57_020179 [Chelydra serpentina]